MSVWSPIDPEGPGCVKGQLNNQTTSIQQSFLAEVFLQGGWEFLLGCLNQSS